MVLYFIDHTPKTPRSSEKRQVIALISLLNDPTTNNLARRTGEMLAQLGWQVDIFTSSTPETSPNIIDQSLYCRLINLAVGKDDFSPDKIQQNSSQFIEAFQKFQTKHGSNCPIIHTFDWLSGWIGLQLKNKINVQFVHTFDSLSVSTDNQQLIQRKIAQTADRIIVTCEKDDGVPSWLPIDKVEILPKLTQVNLKNRSTAMAAKRELGLYSSELTILYADKFACQKKMETLIRAFHNYTQNFPKTRLVLVETDKLSSSGKGTKQYLLQLVRELNLSEKVLFAGLIKPSLLPLYYQAADICAVPSLEEPLSKVTLEAAAWDIPVIAANEPGLRFTIVPEVTGWLVPSEDIVAWHSAIALSASACRLRTKYQLENTSLSLAKITIYLSYLYRYLLASTLTQQLKWNSPLVPWQNSLGNLIGSSATSQAF